MTRKTALTITVLVLSITMLNAYTSPVNAALMLQTDMPTVFIDPDVIDVTPGEDIQVALRIFNLSNNFYTCDEEWELGEDLPPPGTLMNYSLGNLYGFDIKIQWDPTILNYTSHLNWIPVETYPGGILHGSPLAVKNEVNATAGTFWIAYASMGPGLEFNAPDQNATVFTMNFTVLANTPHTVLNITMADLAVPVQWGTKVVIPHRIVIANIIPEFPSPMILPLFMITALLVAMLLKRKTTPLRT